jgi:hypothetical protein
LTALSQASAQVTPEGMHTLPRLGILARVAVATVLLAGCQATSSAAPSGAAGTALAPTTAPAAASLASSAPTAVPTSGAAGTPVPTLLRLELGAAPILEPEDGPPNSLYALPAAAARAQDGSLVLVVIWFPSENAAPVITSARSTDAGVTWHVGTTNLLEGLVIGDPDPGPIPAALLQLDDGSWQMYGWAAANSSGTRFWSWRTSAPDVDGPWAIDRLEMLDHGPSGAWDSHMAAAASVLRTDDGYLLWYEGEAPGNTNRGDIGLATSTDGLAWTKFDDPTTTEPAFAASDPVIRTGTCPGTDVAVEQVQVEPVGDQLVALFGGYGPTSQMMEVYGALSDDGRTWRCATAEPLLVGEQISGGEGLHTMTSLSLPDGSIGLVLESLTSGHSELWWATVELIEE